MLISTHEAHALHKTVSKLVKKAYHCITIGMFRLYSANETTPLPEKLKTKLSALLNALVLKVQLNLYI